METENPQGNAPPPFPEGAKRPQSPPPPPPPGSGQAGPGQWGPGYQGNRWDRRADRWAERSQRRQARWERRMAGCGGPGNSGGLFIGLFITALGLAFLLRNLNIVYFDNIGQYWPVILIAFGISRLTGSRNMHEALPGIALTGVGAIFLLRTLNIITINPWQFFWPVVLIFFGVSMLLRHLDGGGPPPPPPSGGAGGGPAPPGGFSGGFSGPGGTSPGPSRFTGSWENVGGSDAKRLYVDLVFSGTQRKIISQEFEGGKVVAVFSGAEIDLREAAIKVPEIVLHCDAVFGGIEVWVPQHWTIDVRGTGVFGAFHDQTLHRPVPPSIGESQLPPQPRLVVKGGAVFGGVTIKN